MRYTHAYGARAGSAITFIGGIPDFVDATIALARPLCADLSRVRILYGPLPGHAEMTLKAFNLLEEFLERILSLRVGRNHCQSWPLHESGLRSADRRSDACPRSHFTMGAALHSVYVLRNRET